MGKPRKVHRQQRFQYDRNRRNEWRRRKKLPQIECEEIKKAWNKKKSIKQNMRLMGLSSDPNVTLRIPSAKELLSPADQIKETKKQNKIKQTQVVKDLEEAAKAAAENNKRLQLSEPEVRYCVYMLEKYGDDYKTMARDRKNYYQDTPKQIKKKIMTFKNTTAQYNAYLTLKDVVRPAENECTPEKVFVNMAARKRKATRKYIARRRNGHYISPEVTAKSGSVCTVEVSIHKVKRKLNFGRKPPTLRENVPESQNKRETSPERTMGTSKQSPKKRKMSKELTDLLKMADDFIHMGNHHHCKGEQSTSWGAYGIHSSPEHMNLTRGKRVKVQGASGGNQSPLSLSQGRQN